jgi:outer membrane biosynthesis protein TonB
MHLHRQIVLALCALLVAACKSVAVDPYRIDLPDRLGVPIAVLELEVPAAALQENETARFDIEFEVDLRGHVERSRTTASTRPDLDQRILEQHRQWIYAISTRTNPCVANAFVGTQHVEFTRRDGKVSMALEPARVERNVSRAAAEWVAATMPLKPETARLPSYPRQALLDKVHGTVGVMFEFGPDGKAHDAFAVNGVLDRWGLARAAVDTVSRYELKEPPGRTVLACQTFAFTTR